MPKNFLTRTLPIFAVFALSSCTPGLPPFLHNATSQSVIIEFHSEGKIAHAMPLEAGSSFGFGDIGRIDVEAVVRSIDYLVIEKTLGRSEERLGADALVGLIERQERRGKRGTLVVCIGEQETIVRVGGGNHCKVCESGDAIEHDLRARTDTGENTL